MILRLILLFTLVPLAELAILIQLGRLAHGVLPVLALVLVTGLAGAALARWQGLRAWRQIRRDLADGILPGDGLLDGLLVLLAGALLVTPGLLTDAVGFALLAPPLRRVARERIKAHLRRRLQSGSIRVQTFWHEPD